MLKCFFAEFFTIHSVMNQQKMFSIHARMMRILEFNFAFLRGESEMNTD